MTSATDSIDRATWWKAGAICFAATVIFFVSRSPGLDEWDSVQFALGVREFNLWKHQPHPPGYPVYIFLGWSARQLWNWDPDLSLHLLSALGGGLFLGAWFGLFRLSWSERFSWLVTGTLAAVPTVWMTSTQVLTDMFAAGLFSAGLLAAELFRRRKRARYIFIAALIGGITVGARPQLIVIVLLVLASSLWHARAPKRVWSLVFGLFLAVCLSWLLPTMMSQARVSPGFSEWLAYPAQLNSQWRWRLDKPHAFIGASDFSPRYFALRLVAHILGWFGVGFGFLFSPLTLVLGGLLVTAGLILYLAKRPDEDREFWRIHRLWALAHIAIIFCCLPANQRYYLIVYPFLIVAILRGLQRVPGGIAPFALPILFTAITAPLALANHREDAPPRKLVRSLEERYPARERAGILVFVREDERHLQWYAPDFARQPSGDEVGPAQRGLLLDTARAAFSDDAQLSLPPGWRLQKIAEFHRSRLIELKQRDVILYQIVRNHP